MPEIEIFKARTHRAMNGREVTIDLAGLTAIAAGYDPAHGWVEGLRVAGGA